MSPNQRTLLAGMVAGNLSALALFIGAQALMAAERPPEFEPAFEPGTYAFPYRGYLELDGEPVDGDVDFTVTLDHTDEAGYAETHDGVAVYGGEFHIMVGRGDGDGLPPWVFENEGVTLALSVDGTPLTNPQVIHPVPSAVHVVDTEDFVVERSLIVEDPPAYDPDNAVDTLAVDLGSEGGSPTGIGVEGIGVLSLHAPVGGAFVGSTPGNYLGLLSDQAVSSVPFTAEAGLVSNSIRARSGPTVNFGSNVGTSLVVTQGLQHPSNGYLSVAAGTTFDLNGGLTYDGPVDSQSFDVGTVGAECTFGVMVGLEISSDGSRYTIKCSETDF